MEMTRARGMLQCRRRARDAVAPVPLTNVSRAHKEKTTAFPSASCCTCAQRNTIAICNRLARRSRARTFALDRCRIGFVGEELVRKILLSAQVWKAADPLPDGSMLPTVNLKPGVAPCLLSVSSMPPQVPGGRAFLSENTGAIPRLLLGARRWLGRRPGQSRRYAPLVCCAKVDGSAGQPPTLPQAESCKCGSVSGYAHDGRAAGLPGAPCPTSARCC